MNKDQLNEILRFDIPEPEKRELRVNEILALQPTEEEIESEIQRMYNKIEDDKIRVGIKSAFRNSYVFTKNFKR